MLSVEEETQMEESRRRMRLDVKKRAQEKEEFRRRAAMEGIESAKRTAERIFERKVPENIRSERASSPPQLLALRRIRAKPWGGALLPSFRFVNAVLRQR